jgi:hypothetical protein
LELTKIVLFVYFPTTTDHCTILHPMDPFLRASPARECSHSTCHNIIPATEAGIKQYKTCVDCRVRDATTRKRKRHEAKATAAQQATVPAEGVSAEASAGISAGNGPNSQKRRRTTGPTFISEDSDNEHDSVSIASSIALKVVTHHL